MPAMRSSGAGTCRNGSSTPAATVISRPVAPLTNASASSTVRRKELVVVVRGESVEVLVVMASMLAPAMAVSRLPGR
jgi:hypothetical protein